MLVTLSGADETIDVLELVKALASYDRVELAFQFSHGRAGTQRYPSASWLHRTRSALCGLPLRAAIHVNGSACAGMLAGNPCDDLLRLLEPVHGLPVFTRVQVNMSTSHVSAYGAPHLVILAGHLDDMGIRLVLQSKPTTIPLLDELDHLGIHYDVLHDSSEGRGERGVFPSARFGRWNAWAGGITPDTLAGDMPAIMTHACANDGYGWGIDAETGLRDGSTFSIAKAVALVSIAQSLSRQG